MAKLIAESPCAGLLPQTVGGFEITEYVPRLAFSVAPFKGKQALVSKALKSALGLSLPTPNKSAEVGDIRALWIGLDQWLVMGADVPELDGAAVTDQSDAWAFVRISGKGVEDVLARLVPVDLRRGQFRNGQTARTMIAHMTGSVTRIGAHEFEIMVMRSMAATLVHDVVQAAEGYVAR